MPVFASPLPVFSTLRTTQHLAESEPRRTALSSSSSFLSAVVAWARTSFSFSGRPSCSPQAHPAGLPLPGHPASRSLLAPSWIKTFSAPNSLLTRCVSRVSRNEYLVSRITPGLSGIAFASVNLSVDCLVGDRFTVRWRLGQMNLFSVTPSRNNSAKRYPADRTQQGMQFYGGSQRGLAGKRFNNASKGSATLGVRVLPSSLPAASLPVPMSLRATP